MNDAAAITQTMRAKAHARFAEGAETNAFGQNFRLIDVQDTAALGQNA
jgi:hypothetical protein